MAYDAAQLIDATRGTRPAFTSLFAYKKLCYLSAIAPCQCVRVTHGVRAKRFGGAPKGVTAMQLTLGSLPLVFEIMPLAFCARIGRFGLHTEAHARVAGEPRLWIERLAGAWRGRIGPLLFVVNIPETQSTLYPFGPQGENEG